MRPIEIVQGLENGARNVLGVLVACASAGIIIGVVTKTGVGLKLASALLDLSGGSDAFPDGGGRLRLVSGMKI